MWNRVWSDLTQFNPSGHFGGNNDITGGNGITASTTGTLYQLMTGNGIGINSDTQTAETTTLVSARMEDSTVNGFIYRRRKNKC